MARTWREPKTDRFSSPRKQRKKPNLRQMLLKGQTEDMGYLREIRMRDQEKS